MRCLAPRILLGFALALALAWTLPAQAAGGRVIKVLPQLLDLGGQHTVSPSLYDRDAYQAWLRQNPAKVSGLRFAIQYKAHGHPSGSFRLKVEIRGVAKGDLPSHEVLETTAKSTGWFSHWTDVRLTGESYTRIGTVTAWRVTLWDGDTLLAEQKSFLW
jgi:hypothetical protein